MRLDTSITSFGTWVKILTAFWQFFDSYRVFGKIFNQLWFIYFLLGRFSLLYMANWSSHLVTLWQLDSSSTR